MTYQDVGSDLQFRWSGSLAFNSSGSTFTTAILGIRTGTGLFNGEQAVFGMNTDWQQGVFDYTRSPGPNTDYIFPGNSDPNFSYDGSAGFGDPFGFRLINSTQANVFTAANYTSRSDISGGMTIAGQSVSSTGITDASFSLSSGDTISFQAVPEPSSTLLAFTGLLSGAGMLLRCRRATSTPKR